MANGQNFCCRRKWTRLHIQIRSEQANANAHRRGVRAPQAKPSLAPHYGATTIQCEIENYCQEQTKNLTASLENGSNQSADLAKLKLNIYYVAFIASEIEAEYTISKTYFVLRIHFVVDIYIRYIYI